MRSHELFVQRWSWCDQALGTLAHSLLDDLIVILFYICADGKPAISHGTSSPSGQKLAEIAVEASENDNCVILEKKPVDSSEVKEAMPAATSSPPITNKPAKRRIIPIAIDQWANCRGVCEIPKLKWVFQEVYVLTMRFSLTCLECCVLFLCTYIGRLEGQNWSNHGVWLALGRKYPHKN